MSDFVTMEDAENIRELLYHHLGRDYPEELAQDLFRYCTRLRCQPNTRAHTDQGFQVPAHRLIGSGK